MIMDVGAFSVVFFVTYFVIHGSLRVVVLGWICVVISVCCFAAPLSILIPNVLGFAMGFLQLVIYGIYRNSGTNEEREQEMM
ncbi:hypothetical protein RJT34_04085 [Clitoria ternatea]|uniref:Uncharacterized protein n=1 Tax=Clitoria ternatea TaxID=43366 RepID=A0AAN9KKL9_CLITE